MNPCLLPPHLLPLAAVGLLALTSAAALAAGQPLTNRDGAILADGKPRLILGLYENPGDDARLRQAVEAGFNLFQCGADAKALDRLHRVGAMGWVNVGGELDLSVDTNARRARLQGLAHRLAKHPALLLWEGPDEALWGNWYGTTDYMWTTEYPAMNTVIQKHDGAEADALRELRRRMGEAHSRALWSEAETARRAFWQRAGEAPPQTSLRLDDMNQRAVRTGHGIGAGIRALREADPNHIIWLNHAPRNSLRALRLYNREADMAGCDIYPIPYNLDVGHSDLVNMRPSSVGEYTDRMRRAAPGKACAMVLQGFGWRDLEPAGNRSEELRRFGIGRRPTRAETRFMAYDALMHGANAIMYWGTAYSHEEVPDPKTGAQTTSAEGSRIWQDLLAVARELRALEPALIAPEARRVRVSVDETLGSIDGAGVRASVRQVGSDWVLLVANENTQGVAFTVRGLPAEVEGATLYRLGTAETQTVRRGALRDGIAPSDVYVYATSRRFEPVESGAK
jgi:hypothetical protein